MDGLVDGPDHEAVGWVLATVGVCDEEIWFAATGAGGGWEEAEGLFDDGESVWELVEDVGFFGHKRRRFGEIEPEDVVVLGAEQLESCGVAREEMVDPTDGTGGCVMAGEDK